MMRYPSWVTPTDAFDHQWFNDVTQVISGLEHRIMQLEATIRAMQVKCHCGNQALVGDYLCADHRRQLAIDDQRQF
jgi:hypothetical protein